MPTIRSIPLLITLATLAGTAQAAKLEDVAPYPKAEAGFTRQVIHLPKQKREDQYKVEIMAGKTLTVDCNHQRLGGTLEEKTLEGWGYPFYRLESVNGPTSTLMACPDGKTRKDFVPVVGEGFLLRYNSKLPIVVYAPEGVEVRYRLWSAGKQIKSAKVE
ncbi:serine protease inhibitor ecotin [Pseudomonas putida]|uniref:serine protease inhibitor ecotin n=1 Tax=Pseudomonas putida TaxID=303 RepID=UPI0023637851|nr:serine protease inhibitor ecotin [Pseudomonas putida]MDD2055368.1 serine protease inhibitor ecotin [Pseudomonas putida]